MSDGRPLPYIVALGIALPAGDGFCQCVGMPFCASESAAVAQVTMDIAQLGIKGQVVAVHARPLTLESARKAVELLEADEAAQKSAPKRVVRLVPERDGAA